jgi:predicted lipase
MQATLAAYDIAAYFPSLTVSCYTFGAPRTGNRAFADDYSRMVEDTWHIINGES